MMEYDAEANRKNFNEHYPGAVKELWLVIHVYDWGPQERVLSAWDTEELAEAEAARVKPLCKDKEDTVYVQPVPYRIVTDPL